MAIGGTKGRTLKLQLLTDVGDIKKDVSEVNKTIGGLSKTAKTIGVAVAGAFAVDSVIDFAKGAIDAASDLQESQSKVGVVFDDSARKVLDWSRSSATAMGISRQAALEAAGTYGNLMTAMGLSEDAAADMSTQMVQLAADLASFNNMETADVLEKLRSGITGEAEPLKSLGVALSEARVKAYAMANGLADAKGVMTESQKIAARYGVILADTSKAQGDFARASDGLANKQKTLDARTADATARMGEFLMPLGSGLVEAGLTAIDTLDSVGRAFHDLQRWIDPTMADMEDANKALVEAAEAKGLSADVVMAYVEAQDRATRAVEERREAELRAAETHELLAGQFEDYVASFENTRQVWIDGVRTEEEIAEVARMATDAMREQGYALDETTGLWGRSTEAMEKNLTAQERGTKTLSEYMSAVDLAKRTGIGLDAMFDELGTRMERLGIDWVHALGAVGQEVNEGRFRPMGTAAADAWTMAYITSWAAAWKGEVEPTTIEYVRGTMRDVSLTGTRTLHAGLMEGKDRVRQAAIELNKAIENPFEERAYKKYLLGRLTSKKYVQGLKSRDKEVRVQAREMGNIARRELVKADVGAYRAGAGFADRFIDGLFDGGGGALAGVLGGVERGKPRKKPKPRAEGGPVTAGMPYVVGEERPELFVPSRSGTILPSVPTAGMGSTTIINYVTVNASPASDLASVGRATIKAIQEAEKRQGAGWRK